MKRFLVILIAVSLLPGGATEAATILTDTELGSVSGAGIDPELPAQGLAQTPQKATGDTKETVPAAALPQLDGMELAPELMAVLQSSIDANRKRELRLQGATQQGAVAFNLENVIASDSIATSNIYDGSFISPDSNTAEIEINQVNILSQLHRSQGELSSSAAGYHYEETIESRSGRESYDYYSYSQIDVIDRKNQVRNDSGFADVQVGKTINSLDELNADVLPIAIIPTEDYGPYFKFGPIGGTLDAGWFGEYGAELGYTGTTLTGVGLDIDNISNLEGDLVLGTTLTMPKVDFGNLDIKGCFVECAETYFSLGSVGGQEFSRDIKIAGMATEIDELNLGTGFAIAGRGSINMSDPVHFGITGEASIKVSPYASVTLDLSKVKLIGVDVAAVIDDILGQNKWTTSLEFDLIDLNIPFKVVELDVEPFSIAFDGALLASLYGEDASGDMDHSSSESLYQDNSSNEIWLGYDNAESSYNESYHHSAITGGQLTGAEAELLALSDGSLSVDSSSNIVLSDNAQQNMRIINGINATSSIAANALNISRQPIFRGGSNMLRSTTTQQNLFNQQL